MKFFGYRRTDGTVGIRNHVLILPTVGCANETCRIIAGLISGAVSLVNQNGCGEVEGNRKITQMVMSGLAANPNVYGVILVGLGCEPNSVDVMADMIRAKTSKPIRKLVIKKKAGRSTPFAKQSKWLRTWCWRRPPAGRKNSICPR